MQAELSVATFVKVAPLATQEAQDETRNMLIFLASWLLLVKKCV